MLPNHSEQSQRSHQAWSDRAGLSEGYEQHTLPPPGFQLAWGRRGKRAWWLLQKSGISNLDGILTGPSPIADSFL